MNKKNIYRNLFYYFKTFTPDLVVKENKKFIDKIFNNKSITNKKNLSYNKINFYIIRISPGEGFFSNFGYVLNHLKIADKKKLVPIIDMENFPTHYNEPNQINFTKNSWEYYFKKVSKYKLSNIYKKKNIYITDKKYPKFFNQNYGGSKTLKKIKEKYIKLNPLINKKIKKLNYSIFKKNSKVLGIYYRAGDMRTAAKHPFPPTIDQIIYAAKKIINKDKCNRIFISSEDSNFIRIFKKTFGHYDIRYLNCFRYDKIHPYFIYPRKNHRFKLGRDILLEMLVLSKCDSLIYSESNVIESAKLFSLNKNQKRYIISNGYNSSNPFFARWLWYIKSSLPKNFGGFNKKII